MVAVTDNDFLAFKNVGGYLSLRLYGDDVSVSKVTLKANNGEKIAGKGLVTIPLGGLPTVEMDATGTDEITIICDPAVKIGPDAEQYTSFWFVIPPVTFEKGFTVTVTDDKDGEYTVATSKPFTVSRNKLDWMTAVKVVPDYTNAAVEFDDEDFEAYCLQHFDTNNDGVISKSEAAVVEEIDVCTDNISSLGGIEYFTGLKSLKCAGSGIATRSGNSDFTGQLESIELGSLILLEELDCHENNLEELDLSGNPNLDNVDCTNNPMTVIHLAPGQVIPTLESPEDTQIVHDWGDGIGPESFPDPEFRAYVFENFDTDNNGFLSEQECDAVTSIDVDTKNISSLQGIEYFVNLEDLFCRLNNWSTLKKYFNTETHEWHTYDANDNEVIGSLSSLDVSSNTSLKRLYCIGNQLTSIDVSNNTALTVLNCSYNQIESLNVSNNVALTYLDCSYNKIESLNVSNNVALAFLSCSLNYVESLDVSNNTALTTFYCDYNQLGSIDVSNNSALTAFSCRSTQLETIDVSNNTSLSRFWCDYNQLTSLDVSNNLSLTELWCQNNNMSTLYMTQGQIIANLTKDDTTVIKYKDSGSPSDEIWYISTTGGVINPNANGEGFGDAQIISNTYEGGKGIIKFDRPIVTIGASAFSGCNFRTVILPEGLAYIEDNAFENCKMATITLPSTLTRIGYRAFCGSGLLVATIPESVTEICDAAFDNCRNLQGFEGKFATEDHLWLIVNGKVKGFTKREFVSYTIPSGVNGLGDYLFHAFQFMTSVRIPESVSSIGAGAFEDCTSLNSITIDSTTPPALGSYQGQVTVFDNSNDCPIYVPDIAIDTYKNASGWVQYADRIKPHSDLLVAVDLGLSVKWASFNLGANSPEESGGYYSWGETNTKNDYSWTTYLWCNGTQETINKYFYSPETAEAYNLTLENDAANCQLGEGWRMPTISERDELYENCAIKRDEINGVSVVKLTSTINGNSIYLPISGFYIGSQLNSSVIATFWTSSLYGSDYLAGSGFILCTSYSGSATKASHDRCIGIPIRPVKE